MAKKRKVFKGYMTVEGLHVELQGINLETGESSDLVSLSFPPEYMDDFVKRWQECRDGTNEQHCLMYRTYFDDHPDMDWQKYLSMEFKRLEEKKKDQE